ncbi:hypothetical protein O9929_11310 [Vibrio lentus]|nr:hypothetical protein [Vibrio lentus]
MLGDIQENIARIGCQQNTNQRSCHREPSKPNGWPVCSSRYGQAAYDANMNKVIDEVAGEDSTLWDQFNNEKAAERSCSSVRSIEKVTA